MKIAIVGTGNLGCSIAKGLITTNAITSLYLTKRNLKDIEEFEGYSNVYLTSDNKEAAQFCGATGTFGEYFRRYQRLVDKQACVDFYHHRFFSS